MNARVDARLIPRISELMDRYSTEQHELARRLEVLRRARTELRLGRAPAAVLALLEEEVGEDLETMVGGQETDRVIFPVEAGYASAPPPAMNLFELRLR